MTIKLKWYHVFDYGSNKSFLFTKMKNRSILHMLTLWVNMIAHEQVSVSQYEHKCNKVFDRQTRSSIKHIHIKITSKYLRKSKWLIVILKREAVEMFSLIKSQKLSSLRFFNRKVYVPKWPSCFKNYKIGLILHEACSVLALFLSTLSDQLNWRLTVNFQV